MPRAYLVAPSEDPAAALALRDEALADPGPGQVRVRMRLAPVNPADLLRLTGRHLATDRLPSPIGIEGLGEVEAAGPGVSQLPIGAPVAVPFGGTWASSLLCSAADLVRIPEGRRLDPEQTCMLCVNPVTAAGLLDSIPAGDWVIQNAAASAVGRMVARLAQRRGVHVLDVVRRQAQVEALRAAGAEAVLVDGPDLAARVRAKLGDAPVRWAFDAVAGDAGGRLLACLADDGVFTGYGLLSSDDLVRPARDVVFRGLTVRGFTRVRYLRGLSAVRREALYTELLDRLAAGDLHTEVEAVYPLSRVHEAVAHAARAQRAGKILLDLTA